MKLQKGDRVRIGGVLYGGQKNGGVSGFPGGSPFGLLGSVQCIVGAAVDVLIDGHDSPTRLAACILFPEVS